MFTCVRADLDEIPAGVAALWHGVIKQALWDVEYAHRSVALDGLEFLQTTGVWLDSVLPVHHLAREGDLAWRIKRGLSRRIARTGEVFP